MTIRLRTPGEKAARRRKEKQLAFAVENAARDLVDARGSTEISLARARLIVAVRTLTNFQLGSTG